MLAELARVQGQYFEWAQLQRRTKVSIPTLKKLFAAFESMYLIRRVLFLYQSLRTQWMYRPEKRIELFRYESRGGACVPLVIKNATAY